MGKSNRKTLQITTKEFKGFISVCWQSIGNKKKNPFQQETGVIKHALTQNILIACLLNSIHQQGRSAICCMITNT
jgi:hypothetical protein